MAAGDGDLAATGVELAGGLAAASVPVALPQAVIAMLSTTASERPTT